MRKVLRKTGARNYWDKRWAGFSQDQGSFQNPEIYPVKYIDPLMTPTSRSLDAGCGLGRIVKFYASQEYAICGCDYSAVAVEKLNRLSPELDIREADVTALPYDDNDFDNIFAMGLFHSIEDPAAIERGLREVRRCLKPGGRGVISVRADNLENRLIDFITASRGGGGTAFHKWCFRESEFQALLKAAGLTVTGAELVSNVPFLHKFKLLRKQGRFDESEARSRGFELNRFGDGLYRLLRGAFPGAFGTTYVFYIENPVVKPDSETT